MRWYSGGNDLNFDHTRADLIADSISGSTLKLLGPIGGSTARPRSVISPSFSSLRTRSLLSSVHGLFFFLGVKSASGRLQSPYAYCRSSQSKELLPLHRDSRRSQGLPACRASPAPSIQWHPDGMRAILGILSCFLSAGYSPSHFSLRPSLNASPTLPPTL